MDIVNLIINNCSRHIAVLQGERAPEPTTGLSVLHFHKL
jgi:hypothetical protein